MLWPIQARFSWNWYCGLPRSKPRSRRSEITNSAIEAARAMRRIQRWSSERNTRSAPTERSGRNVMTESKKDCVTLEPLPEQHQEQRRETDCADNHPRRVAARVAGLQLPRLAAGGLRRVGRAIDRAIDHAFVDDVPEDFGREPHQRRDDQRAVNFVDEILVVDQRVEPAEAFRQALGPLGVAEIEPPGDGETNQ